MQNQTELNNHSIETWRWNVNPTWTSFSAMIQDGTMYYISDTQFEKNKLSKSCLYFGITSVESFLNQEIRDSMKENGASDNEILETVCGGRRRKKWLESSPIGSIYRDDIYKKFIYYKEIRNEVTHPTRKDQLINDYIEVIDTNEVIDVVKYILVKTCENQNKEFQYWMLGWNYIGYNFNDYELYLSNNLNGFFHSLMRMRLLGLEINYQMDFSKRHMTGYSSFLNLQEKLSSYPFDIEAVDPGVSRPRLTRKWWDRKVLKVDSGETFKDDPERPGWKLGWAIISKYTTECTEFFDSKHKAEYVCSQRGKNYEVKFATHNWNGHEVRLINIPD